MVSQYQLILITLLLCMLLLRSRVASRRRTPTQRALRPRVGRGRSERAHPYRRPVTNVVDSMLDEDEDFWRSTVGVTPDLFSAIVERSGPAVAAARRVRSPMQIDTQLVSRTRRLTVENQILLTLEF